MPRHLLTCPSAASNELYWSKTGQYCNSRGYWDILGRQLMQGVKLCQVWEDQCTGRGSALQIRFLFHLAFTCPGEWSYWRDLNLERLGNSYPRYIFNSLLHFSSVDIQCVTKAFGVTVTLQVNPVKPFSWQFGTRGCVQGSLAASHQGQGAGLWRDPWVTAWVCHPLQPSDMQVPGHLSPSLLCFFFTDPSANTKTYL